LVEGTPAQAFLAAGYERMWDSIRSVTTAGLLREAMRKTQVDQLFTTLGKLAALEPALTEAEIDAELAAARADRARRR